MENKGSICQWLFAVETVLLILWIELFSEQWINSDNEAILVLFCMHRAACSLASCVHLKHL